MLDNIADKLNSWKISSYLESMRIAKYIAKEYSLVALYRSLL